MDATPVIARTQLCPDAAHLRLRRDREPFAQMRRFRDQHTASRTFVFGKRSSDMGRATRWSRMMLAAFLPLLMLGITLLSARSVDAVGCGDPPELAAPAVQAQERWRYVSSGGGSYQLAGWTPTEVTLLVNSPGCAISHIALVGLDLLSGSEMWRVTYDQLQGEITDAATDSGLAILVTSDVVYAFDETTGAQLWSAAHGYEGWPQIVAIE